MADNGRLTVDQKVKVILFYAETKSVVETQRRFLAHFGTSWGSLQSRQFTDFANNLKLMVLCWRRSGRVPPVSIHLQSCDECKGSFARGCEAKRWSHWTCSSLGTIFKPMRINCVPDVKCFCNNKNVLCIQSMVWHFVRHPVLSSVRDSPVNMRWTSTRTTHVSYVNLHHRHSIKWVKSLGS